MNENKNILFITFWMYVALVTVAKKYEMPIILHSCNYMLSFDWIIVRTVL